RRTAPPGGLSYGNSFESHFHNGSPLQSLSTGGLDNETGVNFWSLINGSTAKQPKPVSGEITLAATER
ncbi:hypothetical protein, partial [Salmonella enterica]|uniref:hypothetical protein n=1 Tax=Salmonella enterica TaxID=28901 RepID=UPI001F281F13